MPIYFNNVKYGGASTKDKNLENYYDKEEINALLINQKTELTTYIDENVAYNQNCETVFNDDGTIVETTPSYTLTTTFNEDSSITELYIYTDGTSKTVTTIFNEDGSISEVIS